MLEFFKINLIFVVNAEPFKVKSRMVFYNNLGLPASSKLC
jgi:hypothetical protein